MNTAPSSLQISSCHSWPATKADGIHGVYPGSNSNKLWLVDGCLDVLYAYSARGTIVPHWYIRWVVNPCRYRVTCLFTLSDSQSVCGWNAMDMSSLVYNISLTCAQKSHVKHMSLSLTISQGTPSCHMMVSKNSSANSAASIVLVQGMHWPHLEKRSTKVTMQSFPLNKIDMSVLKCPPMSSQWHCATDSGFNIPTTLPAHWLTRTYVSQPSV